MSMGAAILKPVFQRYKYLRGLPVAALSFNAWYTQIQAAEADGLLMLEIFLHEDTLSAFEDELGRSWESLDSEPHPDVWNKLRHEIVQEAINNVLTPAAITWLRDDLKQRADDIVAERCQKELENVSCLLVVRVLQADRLTVPKFIEGQCPTLQHPKHASRQFSKRHLAQFRTRRQTCHYGNLPG